VFYIAVSVAFFFQSVTKTLHDDREKRKPFKFYIFNASTLSLSQFIYLVGDAKKETLTSCIASKKLSSAQCVFKLERSRTSEVYILVRSDERKRLRFPSQHSRKPIILSSVKGLLELDEPGKYW
jgi:hypothetical protein